MIDYILDFIVDEDWKKMIYVDLLTNKALTKDFYKYIKKIETLENIEETILSIKQESLKYLEKQKKEKNIIKKYKIERQAYAYYGLIEVITEGSKLTEYIYTYFKDNLELLSKIDKNNPSELTKFNKKECNTENNKYVELYLIMKKWQDIEHRYHNDILIHEHNKTKNEFVKYINENKPYIKTKSILKMYYLNYLDELKTISSNELVKAYKILGDELSSIIGGKNLGLVKLKDKKIRGRNFICIPVGSLLKNNTYKFKNKTYSVKSSATVEDQKDNSFAGMFSSILNVKNENINEAIKQVYESINSKRVIEYTKHFKKEKPYMSIVIQEFDEPEYSGVWLGKNINEGILEYTNGNGEKLVSGHVSPKNEIWNNKTKKGFYNIGKECIKLQKKFNMVCDFEFCIINKKLYYVQYRPVTKIINTETKQINKSSINGIPASAGFIKGTIEYIDDLNTNLTKDILLCEYTDPDYVPLMIKAKGIITSEGGFLSHASIISRELGIPCITGIGDENLEILKKAKEISMDGSNGDINII